MSTRIRYVAGPGYDEMTSMRVYTSENGEQYKARMFAGGTDGAIISATDGAIVDTATGTSSHQLKIALKNCLAKLGVNFGIEKRHRNGEDVSDSVSDSEG